MPGQGLQDVEEGTTDMAAAEDDDFRCASRQHVRKSVVRTLQHELHAAAAALAQARTQRKFKLSRDAAIVQHLLGSLDCLPFQLPAADRAKHALPCHVHDGPGSARGGTLGLKDSDAD